MENNRSAFHYKATDAAAVAGGGTVYSDVKNADLFMSTGRHVPRVAAFVFNHSNNLNVIDHLRLTDTAINHDTQQELR